MKLFKGQGFKRDRRLDIEVYRKPTSLARPLSTSSFHPPGVHGSWPRALQKRSYGLSSSRAAAERDIARLRMIWDSYGIQSYSSPSIPRPLKEVYRRLVLPFHSSLANARFSRIMRRHGSRIATRAGESENGVLQVAWRLGYPRLSTRLQRCLAFEHTEFAKYDFMK